MSLPKGWVKTTFGNCSDAIQYGLTCTSSLSGDGYRYVRITDIQDGRIKWQDVPFANERAVKAKPYEMEIGDILFARTGATVGKSYLVEAIEAPAVFASYLIRLRCTEEILLPQFAARYFGSGDYWEQIAEGAEGTGQPNFNGTKLANLSLPLPPLAEQRRIVTKLEILTSRLERARAELDRVSVLAEQLRKQIVCEAFSGVLTADWRISRGNSKLPTDDALNEAYLRRVGSARRKPPADIEWRPPLNIPSSWRWVSIDQLVSLVQYGSSAKTSSDTNGVPVLRMGNIQGGKLDLTDLKYLPKDHKEFPDLLLDEGDLLFNRTNSFELVGKTAVCKNLNKPTSFASYLIRIKPFGLLAELLSAYLNSPLARLWIDRVASQQVGQANVNGSKLKALGIPLPPFDEQAEMLQRLNNAFVRADCLEAEAARARALLHRLEAAILAKAFSGELVPQDSNDEPADVLLDRIRVQRASERKLRHKPASPRRTTA